MKTFYFMAGLPRSGSTLISSLLNQNPEIYSGPSSPVVPTMLAIENSLSNDELFLAYPKVQQGKEIISSVLYNWYSDIEKPIIIDKNRSWINRVHYISGYFDIEPKILFPVRSIDEILTSFITMHRRNPFNGNGKISFMDEYLIKTNMELNDDNRCEMLCNPNGIIGASYAGLKQIFTEGKEKYVHIIEYDNLINNTQETLDKVYDFLEISSYKHDFTKIENKYREKDKEVYGIPDMHHVREKISKVSLEPETILSKNMLLKCKNLEFWRNNELDLNLGLNA